MKRILIYFIGLILLVQACAESGPFKTGTLDCIIEVSDVTATTALVSVKIPSGSDNLFIDEPDVYLTDQNLSSSQSFVSLNEDHKFWSSTDVNGKEFFKGLSPNTTYYVVLGGHIDYNGDSWNHYRNEEYYYTGYSFTTESDYSSLGEFKFEFVGNYGVKIFAKLSLPSSLTYIDTWQNDNFKCFVSHKSDMIESVPGYIDSYDRYLFDVKDNEVLFYFYSENLEKGKYYVSFSGELSVADSAVGGYRYSLDGKNIKIDGPIEYGN